MFGRDKWFDTIRRSYDAPPIFFRDEELPGFPPAQIQINTTGQAGPSTLKEAFIFYEDCAKIFAKAGNPLREDQLLLDFGCGWGRIARFFLKNMPSRNIHGIDVSRELVDICRATYKNANFDVTAPYPPAQIPDRKFTFVVGYSVFSHLSEDACASWMKEFHRILVPGGMVALTTRGRPFFNFCKSLRHQGHTGYLEALSTAFDDFDEAIARYDRGEFVHSNKQGVAGGGAMTSDFYGETFIPESYAREAYSNQFRLIKFLFKPRRQAHPIMFFQKI